MTSRPRHCQEGAVRELTDGADAYPLELARRVAFSVSMPARSAGERQAVVEMLVDIPDTSLVGVEATPDVQQADTTAFGESFAFDVLVDTTLPHVALLARARAVELSDRDESGYTISPATTMIRVNPCC